MNFKFYLTLNSHIWPVARVLGRWQNLASGPLPLLKVRWDCLGDWRSIPASYLNLDAPDGTRSEAARREEREIGAIPGRRTYLAQSLALKTYCWWWKQLIFTEHLQGARNCALYPLSHLVVKTILSGRFYCIHFTNEEAVLDRSGKQVLVILLTIKFSIPFQP